jgi:hypothetical protein
MTKREGMANNQMPNDCDVVSLSFEPRAFFVIRRSPALRHLLLAVIIALKNSIGTEFVERVRAFFSGNGPLSKVKIGT